MQTTTAVVRRAQNIKHTFWSNSQLTCASSSALVVCQQGRERAGCILLLSALEIGHWKLHKVGLLHLTALEVLLRSIKTGYHPYFIWKSHASCQPFALDAHKDKGVLSRKGSNPHTTTAFTLGFSLAKEAKCPMSSNKKQVQEFLKDRGWEWIGCSQQGGNAFSKLSYRRSSWLQKAAAWAFPCCHRDQNLINWTSSPEGYV